MIKAIIDGYEIEIEKGTTILDAAKKVQINIPTLCYHPDLPATAACGICIVKVKQNGTDKILRACCTPVENGMEIVTNDPEVIVIRQNVLQLILSNHPNECLECERNGSCELQKLAWEFGIKSRYFENNYEKLPEDDSTRIIILHPEKCIKCGRCLEVCQQMQNVWALSFLERGIKTRFAPAGDTNDVLLDDSPCIRCGQCAEHCPVGAIVVLDQTKLVWEALRNEDKYCDVQIAPSVRAAIGESFGFEPGTILTGKLYSVLRRLGFKAVFDTNFAADVTIMEEASEFVERFVHEKKQLPLITTCCPSWVDFMEKHHPDMIPHFSSCKSPQQIMGVLAKTYYAEKMGIDPEQIFMVSIMPCTSKKFEIIRSMEMFSSGHRDVDIVLTTRELGRMIKQTGLDFARMNETEPDYILGDYSGAGTIFGASGGVLEAALRTANHLITHKELEKVEFEQMRGLEGIKEAKLNINGNEIRVAAAHGLANVETILNGEELPYHFVEVMACKGGCIGGGGQPYGIGINNDIRLKRMAGLYADDKNAKTRYSHKNPYIIKLYEDFLETPLGEKAERYLHTSYRERVTYKK